MTASKQIDPDRIRFSARVRELADDLNASVEGPEAKAFVNALYAAWQQENRPQSEIPAWLKPRLQNAFRSLAEPPRWVEEEPDWAFHNGQPMVFISQTTLDDSEVSQSSLSPGETVYLFGTREPEGTGFRMVYKVVSQFEAP